MNSLDTETEEPSKVTEEAILDGLFHACDVDKAGHVPVSRLVEYLRNAVAKDSSDNNTEFANNLDDLSLILDPDGQDVHISITTYQAGISEWIEDIRRRSIVSTDEEFFSPVTVNCMSPFEPVHQNGTDHVVTSTPNVSSDSVEGVGGESPKKNDWDRAVEMMSVVESLQANNKRLLEQHSTIQTQMELADDTNAQLSTEVESLKKQVQNLQITAAKYKDLKKENTDLRQAVAESQETTKTLQNRNSLLEKEKQSLEENIETLKSKVTELQSKVEDLIDERKTLTESLALQKEVNIELVELRNVKEELVEETSTKTEYLSSIITKLFLANEELKAEKSKLEEVVMDLNNELLRRSKHDGSVSPVAMSSPNKFSTPVHRPFSLKQELQAQLTFDSRGLPSPLIGNSICYDSLDGSGMDTSAGSLNQSWMSSMSYDSANTNTSMERYSMIASQVANECKEKKDEALRQINELANLDKCPEVNERHEVIKTQLNQEMDQFAEKVNLLCLKKKTAEKRSAKLLIAIKKLKEESKQLLDERDKAYQKLGNLSLNSDQLDSRIAELRGDVSKEKAKAKEMEDTIKNLEEQLANITCELSKIRDERDSFAETLGIQSEERETLERKLIDVHRSQSQLDLQQTHQILRIKDLENELSRAASHLALEKTRTAALEESLHLSVSKHSGEMQEIMDVIPVTESDLLNRSKQSPRSSSPRITGHALRSRLQDYVTYVQSVVPLQGAVRDAPDGKPRSELDENSQDSKFTESAPTSDTQPRHRIQDLPSPPVSSVSSQSPDRSPQSPRAFEFHSAEVFTGVSASPPGLHRATKTTGSQTDLTTEYIKVLERDGERKHELVGSRDEEAKTPEPKMLSLWKNKLAVSFRQSDGSSSFRGDGQGFSGCLNSSNFVDGVSLHVRPTPTEKEVEKQFRTLVLAFQTDQMTLHKRLEVQERNREVAERNMEKELESMSSMLKEYEEKYIRTRELQQVAASLGSQIEVLRSSCQRVSSAAHQRGSVQQEARMSSGIEVMICHAENTCRHLERVKEDLSEFRRKESGLQSEDSDVIHHTPTLNGPTRLGGYGGEGIRSEEADKDTSDDGKQNSLANFMMAIHNTSVRARQVLKNFRRRTIDAGSLYSSQEEGADIHEEPLSEGDEGEAPSAEEPGDDDMLGAPGGTSGEESAEEDEETEREPAEVTRDQKQGICRRVCGALFRFLVTLIILMILLLGSVVFLNEYTPYKIQREYIPTGILNLLDPVAVLVHPP